MKVSKLVDILTMDHKSRVNVEGFMLEQQLAKQVEAGGKAGKHGKRWVMGLVSHCRCDLDHPLLLVVADSGAVRGHSHPGISGIGR